MRASNSGRGAVVVAVAVVVALAGGVTGRAPASARREPGNPPPQQGSPPPRQRQGSELYGCDRTFGRQPEGDLVKRTNPAGGQPVRRGDSVVVVLTWEPRDWSSSRLHKVLDCVAIDGRLDPSLQDGESPTPNDGRFSTAFTVPADVPDGTEICDQAMLSGPSPRGDHDRQISNQVCHTVAGGAGSCGQPARCEQNCGGGSPCGQPPPCQQGCADRPCEHCGENPPCSEGCSQPPPCQQGCADRPCEHCGQTPSCSGGCSQPPPCRQQCADRPPCDHGCGRCGDTTPADGNERVRREGPRPCRNDCDCDAPRPGLLHRLIEELV